MFRVPLFLLLAFLAAPVAPSGLVVPDFHDLTVKTRTTAGDRHTFVTTWQFKGTRQREEVRDPGVTDWTSHPTITQCDQGVIYFLNASLKTYSSMPVDPAEMRKRPRPVRQLEMSGGEVTVTTDSVDTGERRQVGSYEARHVRTTITAEPGADAVSKPSKTEIDGWYIDLPGMNCRDDNGRGIGWLSSGSGRMDRLIFRQLGTARRGLAIEETTRREESGRVFVNKTELVSVSEEPLDESLFELPTDYSPSVAEKTAETSRPNESAP